MQVRCWLWLIDGSWKERKAETGSKGLWGFELVVTASGLRGGCGHEG